jgi:signal transduction histidine kinase
VTPLQVLAHDEPCADAQTEFGQARSANTATQFLLSEVDKDTPLPRPWQGDINARDENFSPAVGSLINTQLDVALLVCRKAFTQAQARGDNDAAVAALLRLYGVLRQTGMAMPTLSDVWSLILERADAVVDPFVGIRLSITEMARLIDAGEDAEVLVKGDRALALAMAVGDEYLLMSVLAQVEIALRCTGELGLALEAHQQMENLLRGGEPFAIAKHASRSNNAAMLWLLLAGVQSSLGDTSAAKVALKKAREQAELACSAFPAMHNDMFKVELVDTLIQVLLKFGEPVAARTQLERVRSALDAMPNPGTKIWGLLQLAQTHIDLHEERDPQSILHVLQSVERVQGTDFQLRRVTQRALAQVHERLAQHEQALACHKRLTDWQSKANTAKTRERVKMMRHAVMAIRTEAAEFITHDLRTPLTAARTWLHTVADEQLPASSQRALRETELQLRDAFDLSELYLNVLRAEFLPVSALQPLDLGALTDDMCESLSPPLASRTVLTRDIEIGAEVMGNARLLIRALAALLNHAFARAPTDTAVHVCVARTAQVNGGPLGEVQLSVTDQGGNLSLQSRMCLYGCHTLGTAEGVNPLGLVARVARLHQARILVNGPAAGGSTLTLRFKPANGFSFNPRTFP